MTHLALSEQGYWVFPTTERRKFPVKLGGKEWDTLIDAGDHELLHAHLVQGGSTGAVMCPQPGDPVPVLILDLDTYGMPFEELWAKVAPGEEYPEGMGVVETPSGGYHLWFRLPPDVVATRLPAEVDLGDGVGGELRVSGPARRLIMLPGSLATNKNLKPGKYKAIRGDPLDPTTLGYPPETLISRLVARSKQGQQKETKKGKPTEAMHFLSLLDNLASEIPEGGRNNFVAKVGQVLGRLHPGTQVDLDLLPELWDKLSPRLGSDFKESEFRTALSSGWSKGSKNGEKYQAREKHPTITDIKSECEAIFGSVPWMVEVYDSTGKLKETQVGFGGSAKRRKEASNVTHLPDLKNLLPTLARLSAAPLDVVSRSPLFIQPGWAKALDFMLQAEKGVDTLGVPLEERFWEILEEWARTASADLLFLEGWTSKRPSGMAVPFIVWPKGNDSLAALVLSPYLQEILLTQLGDITATKRLMGKFLPSKTLTGMRKGAKVRTVPVSLLPEEARAYVGVQYENYVRLKAKEDND